MTPKLKNGSGRASKKPVRFLINTHGTRHTAATRAWSPAGR